LRRPEPDAKVRSGCTKRNSELSEKNSSNASVIILAFVCYKLIVSSFVIENKPKPLYFDKKTTLSHCDVVCGYN
jgi:hypothetical protein